MPEKRPAKTPVRRPSVKGQRIAQPTARSRNASRRTPQSVTPSATSIALDKNKILALAIAILAVLVIVFAITRIAGALSGAANSADESGASEEQQGETEASHNGKASGPYSLSFCTTGDLIFWREVADYIDKNGGASAMEHIADHLAQADVTISNVESPLSDDESEPVPNKDIYIIGRPSAIESIKNSDITLASLANNHIMDYTGPALKDTLEALDDAGVLHAGAGKYLLHRRRDVVEGDLAVV